MSVANPKNFRVELASPKPKSLDRTLSIYPNIDILVQYHNTNTGFWVYRYIGMNSFAKAIISS